MKLRRLNLYNHVQCISYYISLRKDKHSSKSGSNLVVLDDLIPTHFTPYIIDMYTIEIFLLSSVAWPLST